MRTEPVVVSDPNSGRSTATCNALPPATFDEALITSVCNGGRAAETTPALTPRANTLTRKKHIIETP